MLLTETFYFFFKKLLLLTDVSKLFIDNTILNSWNNIIFGDIAIIIKLYIEIPINVYKKYFMSNNA